jgi:CRISPR/Cas system-associated protein Csm6
MGLFGDGIKNLVSRIDKMREEYLTMSANFKNLEKAFEKFVEHTDSKTDKLVKENEDLRRRVTEIEGIINATLKTSMKEALQSVVREHLKENGNVNQITNDSLKNLLGPSDGNEKNTKDEQ